MEIRLYRQRYFCKVLSNFQISLLKLDVNDLLKLLVEDAEMIAAAGKEAKSVQFSTETVIDIHAKTCVKLR